MALLALRAGMESTLGKDDQPIGVSGTEHPDDVQRQDLIDDGDLTVGPHPVPRSEAVLIAANSEDEYSWSASVTWMDEDGNVTQTESADDIGLSSVVDDWARLVRKGPEVEVTFTDESEESENNVNAFVDTHV